MEKIVIKEKWKEAFREKKLNSYKAVMEFEMKNPEESCPLCDREIFQFDENNKFCLKREKKIKFLQILQDIADYNFPKTKTSREREVIRNLQVAGFNLPKIIAWGEKTFLGFPCSGFLILSIPEGKTLPIFLESEPDPDLRKKTIDRVLECIIKLQESGCYWPTCNARNFLLLENGDICLLNLETASFHKNISEEKRQEQYEVFYASLFRD